MIIFGSRGVTTTPGRGTFHCPSCGPGSHYELKRVRRFFTLYFIPVIPLDKLGEYVECARCRNTYKPAVLRHDPGAAEARAEAEFPTAVKRIMMLVTLADGVIHDAEIETMASICGRLTGRQVSHEDLLAETRQLQRERRSVADCLRPVAPLLNDHGKELIIKAAITVAGADGHVDPSEEQIAYQAAEFLGMTRAHLSGVLSEARKELP